MLYNKENNMHPFGWNFSQTLSGHFLHADIKTQLVKWCGGMAPVSAVKHCKNF